MGSETLTPGYSEQNIVHFSLLQDDIMILRVSDGYGISQNGKNTALFLASRVRADLPDPPTLMTSDAKGQINGRLESMPQLFLSFLISAKLGICSRQPCANAAKMLSVCRNGHEIDE